MNTPLTADLFARAIIASAISYGDDPLQACQVERGISRRCLAPAAFGIADATRQLLSDVCRPMGLRADNIARAQKAGGRDFAKAQAAASEAVTYHLRGIELAARARAAPPADPVPPAPAEPAPGAEPAVSISQPAQAVEKIDISPPSPRPEPSRPAPKPAAKRPGRAIPKGARFVNLGEGVTRIERRPVSERVARMAKQQLARPGADLDFIAECFGFEPEDITAAVNALDRGEAA